jgi:HEAT repeat protein
VAEQLAILGGSDADLPMLKRAVESQESYVRLAAVRALGRIGTVRAADVIIESLPQVDGPALAEAIRALMRLDDARALPTVQRLLQDRGTVIRTSVWHRPLVAFLVRFADASSIGLLSDGLRDEDTVVRKLAATGLGRIGTAAAVASLEQSVSELGWWRARWARRALRQHTS